MMCRAIPDDKLQKVNMRKNEIIQEHIELFETASSSVCRKATSDIDFYAVVTEHPDRVLSGNLRQDLEDMGADLVYIRKDLDSLLSKEIRRDGVKLL